jgi:F-box/leucine-rich repeat protein 10/11
VYTPVDSLVFGGNFLHSLGIEVRAHAEATCAPPTRSVSVKGQLAVHSLERRTRISKKFCFPMFECAMWFGLAHSVERMREEEQVEEEDALHPDDKLCEFECEGLAALIRTCRCVC